MSGRKSKMKGNRTEREFAKLIAGNRVPLSGAAKHLGEMHTGDVDGLGMKWEVKARKDGFKTFYGWLEEEAIDALAVKADRKPWLVVIPLTKLKELLSKEWRDI